MTSPHARMAVFVSNLRSALPHTFDWLPSITSRIPVSLVKSASIEEGMFILVPLLRGRCIFPLAFKSGVSTEGETTILCHCISQAKVMVK